MRKNLAGPMPVRKFLDDFLSVQLLPDHLTQLPDFRAMAGSRLESQMYDKFVGTLFIILLPRVSDCLSTG